MRTTESGGKVQSIDSTYFNITDARGWPVAGLLLLQDSSRRPVRAELHVDEDMPEHVQDTAIRQSRRLLSQRYAGEEDLELRVLRTYQQGDPYVVPLIGDGVVDEEVVGSQIPWLALAAAIALIFVVASLIWAAITFFRGDSTASEPAANPPIVVAEQPSSNDAGDEVSADNSAATGATAAGDSALRTGSAVCQSSGLATSTNARDDIVVGQNVRLQPGLKVTLRSLPGADAGEGIGYMENEAQAIVIDGPVCTQGDADSIVWWYVRLESGIEAWAAANTSQFTLLVPVG